MLYRVRPPSSTDLLDRRQLFETRGVARLQLGDLHGAEDDLTNALPDFAQALLLICEIDDMHQRTEPQART